MSPTPKGTKITLDDRSTLELSAKQVRYLRAFFIPRINIKVSFKLHSGNAAEEANRYWSSPRGNQPGANNGLRTIPLRASIVITHERDVTKHYQPGNKHRYRMRAET